MHSIVVLFLVLMGLLFPLLAFAVTPIVSASSITANVLKSDGTVWTWGWAYLSGSGGRIPVAVPFLSGIAAVSSGNNHGVAVKLDGTVWAWGNNSWGQLGDGTTKQRSVPVAVPGLTGIVAVSAGFNYTIALKSDGTVWTWGGNTYGQLGDGTTTNRVSPTAVQGLSNIIAISGRDAHTTALRSDGTVWSWGDNALGQLGDGTTTNRVSPTAVQGLSEIIAISAGYDHTIALRSDGTVWAWGQDDSGQLGDGNTTQRNSPVAVPGLAGIIAISAGFYHTIALKSNGRVWAWGGNTFGQLGDGTTKTRYSPVAVTGLAGIVSGSAGSDYTIALKSDGTVWTWGANTYGQLGNGSGNSSYSPMAIPGLSLGATTPIPQGWTLMGNSWSQPIVVATAFGDMAVVTTVWKWDTPRATWQFYTPSLDTAALQTYAASKGYGVLSVINPGEGYWVNAKLTGLLTIQPSTTYALPAASLLSGWNLVATGNDLSAPGFNLSLSDVPPTSGVVPINLTSLWAWDSAQSKWYFYAPSLQAQGGTVLSDYINTNGYLDFASASKTLGPGTGFWIYKP